MRKRGIFEKFFGTPCGDKIIANVDPHVSIEMDQAITKYLDVEKVNIFEPGETGKKVSLP